MKRAHSKNVLDPKAIDHYCYYTFVSDLETSALYLYTYLSTVMILRQG